MGTGNTGGMRGAKRKQIYSSPFEAEWAGLNHRIFHARLDITFKWLWDAQRRAGITDEQITAALEEKLKVNMARQWPGPKDGEPRLHIKP